MLVSDAFVELQLAKDWTPSSRQWYRSRLGAFFDWLTAQGVDQLEAIDAPLVRRYVDQRRNAGTLSSHSLNGHVRAIRAFLSWGAHEGLVDEKLPRRIALPKKQEYVISPLSAQQVERLLNAARASRQPLRDVAIVAVLADTGVRANELCGLKLDQTFLTPNDCFIRVQGKGRRDREINLGARSRLALHRYLTRERRGNSPYTFLGRTGDRLRADSLDKLFRRLRDAAGASHFEGVRCSPHDLRHTFAVRSLESGLGIYQLSRILGHSQTTTTELYLKAVSARDARRTAPSVLDALGKGGRER